MKNNDITIIGAGIGGLSLGSALAHDGYDFNIIERNQRTDNFRDIRTTALMNSTMRFYKHIGVADDIENSSYLIKTIKIISCDSSDNPSDTISFTNNDICAPYLACNIDNTKLKKILIDKIEEKNEISFGTQIKKIDFQNDIATIYDSNGNKILSKLVIGSDGKHSTIRNIAGIDAKFEKYEQSAVIFNIKHINDNNYTSTEILYSSGATTFIPIDAFQSSVIIIDKTEQISRIIDSEYIYEYINFKINNFFEKYELTSNISNFPIETVTTQKLYNNNIAIMAEASHTLTPVAAQGLNLSIRDVATMHDFIIKSNNLNNIDNMLKTYENTRIFDIQSRHIATKYFHKLSIQNNPINNFIKKLAIGHLNNNENHRKKIIEICTKIHGHIPDSMK